MTLYANLPEHVRQYDPLTHMRVKCSASADTARTQALDSIFGGALSTSYTLTPQTEPINWSAYSGADNLSFIQRFTAELPLGMVGNVYFFVPIVGKPTATCAIYHEGHNTMGVERTDLVKALVADGLIVAVIDMPFTGINAPSVETEINGMPCRLWNHAHMALIKDFPALQLFLLPVLATVNHCHINGVTNIAMLGLSGGGWTTTLYAGLDTRILKSYCVSGTMPIYLSGWSSQKDLGEWEQFLSGIELDYLDLYVMASEGRTHWQVGNVNDSGCFAGTRQDCFKTQIEELVTNIGGSFSVVYDTTATSHEISSAMQAQIIADIG